MNNKVFILLAGLVLPPIILYLGVWLIRFYFWFGNLILSNPENADLTMFVMIGVLLTCIGSCLSIAVFLDEPEEN